MTKRPHEDWIDYAERDLSFAELGLEEGFYPRVGYLAQQVVEKGMKGYLVFQGKSYPKSHDLVSLRRLLNVPWLEKHIVALRKLSEFYTPVQYPDVIAGMLPEGLPDKEDATNAVKWAREILETIKSHIKKK